MNIRELITDLRARVNPQYYDQIGTESYERHRVVKALEYLQQENERQRFDILAMNQSLDLMREENERLRETQKTISELEQLAARSNNDLREENERLRKDAAVGAAIQRAAATLPLGCIIGIAVEADAASVDLCMPTGHIRTMDVDDENRLAAEISAAIDAARGVK